MRFTVVVMQINGDITDRRPRTWGEIQRNEVSRRLAEGFRLMLDEQLPARLEGIARFRVTVDEERGYDLDWQQPDRVNALGTFFLRERLALTCLFLSGYDSLRDESAVWASQELLTGWRQGTEMRAGPGIRSVPDRPLVACIPWPGVVDEMNQRRLSAWSVCLAAAFFRRAAAAVGDISNN